MGSAWSSPAEQTGMVQNMSKNQRQGFDVLAQGATGGKMPAAYDITQNPLYSGLFQQIQQQMNPYGSDAFNKQFQEGFVNPAMKTYEQDVLPQLRSQYYQPTASYGAGLNQAINKSAENLQSGLGELRAKYSMSQQQIGTANALGMINQQQQSGQNYWNQFLNASPETALVQGPQSGWLKDIMQMVATAAGGTNFGK